MAMVIYAPSKKGHHDRSIERQVQAFLRKLWDDDTSPGLHIEPIRNCADDKVRTGRVTQMYRAVLFKIVSDIGEPHYVYTGTWPHDEAIKIAQRAVLKVNAVNGIPELLMAAETPVPAPDAVRASAAPVIDDAGASEAGAELAEAAEAEAAAAEPVLGSPVAEGGDAATLGAHAESKGEAGSVPEASAGPGSDVSPVVSEPLLARVNPTLTLAELTGQLGLPEDVAAAAMEVGSDDEMIELADGLSTEWQGLALLTLATGAPLDDVRDTLQLPDAPVDAAGRSEEQLLLEGFKAPAAQSQFRWIEDDAELRAVIESGDFARWRTFLHPEQRKYAQNPTSGPFRLSGGAGTGKTVVLLHRARHLARTAPGARIVLTTFTRTLADTLSRDLRLLDADVIQAPEVGGEGVCVTGIDAAANAVLGRATPDERAQAMARVLGPTTNQGTERPRDGASPWRRAADSVAHKLPAALCSDAFLDAEYQHVVLPSRVTTRDEYLRVRRTGRGVALGRVQREAVWRIIEAYRASAAVDGVLNFAEVAAVAAELAGAAGGLADHVLVDEGQDLSPVQWQFLRALAVPGPDDLFIAEDSQQRIYGQRVVLGRLGIKVVGRSRRLQLNYRTTEQVLEFATRVLSGERFEDLEEGEVSSAGYRSARRGPVPRTIAAPSLIDALDEAGALVTKWAAAAQESGDASAIGILVRDRRMRELVARGFEERQVPVRVISDAARTTDRPQLLTMHRAKGMEFASVLIFGASHDLLPAAYLLDSAPAEDRPDLVQRERALFYVAATRARDELVVMWHGKGSVFLPG